MTGERCVRSVEARAFSRLSGKDPMTGKIIGCAIEVHRTLGPGLLEGAYEACLALELQRAGLMVERQVSIPINYKGEEIGCGYRADLIVEGAVLVELKSVDQFLPIHDAQVLTYLKLRSLCVGLLINFNAYQLRNGIRRLVL